MKTKKYCTLKYLVLLVAALSQAPLFAYNVRVWNRTGENIETIVKAMGGAPIKQVMTADQTYIDSSTGAFCFNHLEVTGLSGKIEGKVSDKVAGNETGGAISCQDNVLVVERVGDQVIVRRIDKNEPFNFYTKWPDLAQDDRGNYMWAYKVAEERDKREIKQQYDYSEAYLAAVQNLCSKIDQNSKYAIPCK